MTLEEIVYLAELLTRHGITDVKLTGGDPLLREDIVEMVAALKRVPGIRSVHLLTRHPRAGDWAGAFQRAGLDCLNFSLDSLDAATWSRITRVGGHAALMAAIRKAAATGITLKINTVVLKGINDHEIPDLVEFAGEIGATLKLLDLIVDIPAFPPTEPGFGRRHYFDLDPIRPMLAAGAVEMEVVYQPGGLGHPMPRFVMQNGATVLVKSSRTGAWYGDTCQTCPLFPCHDAIMAVRLTADGKLQRCLLRQDNLVDLLGLTRSDASTDQIDATIGQVLHTYRYAAFYDHSRLQAALLSRGVEVQGGRGEKEQPDTRDHSSSHVALLREPARDGEGSRQQCSQ